MGLLGLLAQETTSYLRSGLLAASRVRIRKESERRRITNTHNSLGVLLVHGFGANATQFRSLRNQLRDKVDFIDAFEYNWLAPLQSSADQLSAYVRDNYEDSESLVLVGHSLGGLLGRLALQQPNAPDNIAAFISICAPLHGTRASRVAPIPNLRTLRPESRLMQDLRLNSHRLHKWRNRILTIGSHRDHFIKPSDSAWIDEYETLKLEWTGHVGCLFDSAVHERIIDFIDQAGGKKHPALAL